jgi:hypothetical protein
MLPRKAFLWLVVLGGLLIALASCAPMDASKARSRSVIESGGIVPAEELRVAEYLGYYAQSFPQPTKTTLGLDLRLGNGQVPTSGGEAWLQIGIQAKSAQPVEIAPLNLALVIDRSGSMNTPEKMPYVKQSLLVFLRSLAANDIVAIVTYSDEAYTLVPAREVGDGAWIETAINQISPGGSTNLHAGLMLGFAEVDRGFNVRRNNRAILLTDGIANRGVVDPDKIASDAKRYNDKGIYLSTIGLGKEFNDALLSRLATQGKGAYHFVDSAEEMDKVFRRDVSGLVQKAASDVALVFRPAADVRLEALTGYDGTPPAGPIEVRQRDMGTGDSQVLLARLRIGPGLSGQRTVGTVELRYTDLFSQRVETLSLPIYADASRMTNYDPLWDVEVLRNVTIQRTAEALKEVDRLYKARRYQDAYNLTVQSEQELRRVAALTGEAQMVKDADLMRRYQATLSKWLESQRPTPPPEDAAPAEPTRFYRGRVTPTVPVVDVK